MRPGRWLLPLDEGAVEALGRRLALTDVESLAIGFLHSFLRTRPTRCARAILLLPLLPRVTITAVGRGVAGDARVRAVLDCLRQRLCPGRRTWPLSLVNLETLLDEAGFTCPLFLMLSGGGLTTVDTAIRFPVRLVEKRAWPAARSACQPHRPARAGSTRSSATTWAGPRRRSASSTISSRRRAAPSRSPASTASRRGAACRCAVRSSNSSRSAPAGVRSRGSTRLKRITGFGPDSAGAAPGPACYGLGGTGPTVTDADLLLGRIDPSIPWFSGEWRMALDRDAAEAAMQARGRRAADARDVGACAAFGVSEIVDENMANAARVHAIESGKDARGTHSHRVSAARGAPAPDAARMAEKLGLDRVVVSRPMLASALRSGSCARRSRRTRSRVRSQLQRLDAFDPDAANALLAEMRAEAEAIVRRGEPGAPLSEARPRPSCAIAARATRIAVPVPGWSLYE